MIAEKPIVKKAESLESALLARAKKVWVNVRANFRDGCLETGWLLQEYIVAHVKKGDGLSENERLKRELTREHAVRNIAKTLKMFTGKCHELVRIAMAVDVLSKDRHVGSLSYDSLRRLAILAERRGEMTRNREAKGGYVLPSEAEEWQAKTRGAEKLFQTAASEGWSSEETRLAMAKLNIPRHGGRKPNYRPAKEKVGIYGSVSYIAVAEAATPRDLVDLIVQMVEANKERDTVAHILAEKLNNGDVQWQRKNPVWQLVERSS